MSMLLMARVFEVKVGDPIDKLVLLMLANSANDKGECNPSCQSIADWCEIDRLRVVSSVSRLEVDGLLLVKRRNRPGAIGGWLLALDSGDSKKQRDGI